MQRKDCEISEVYQRLGIVTGTIMIELSYKKDKKDLFSEYKTIKIQISKERLAKEIQELFDKKRETCYLAFGMQDIDITLEYIKYSPSDLFEPDYYFFKKGELKKLLATLL